ncbi:MAG TPA: TonB-dependent receptor [Vicinamibacterales bacterium]|nr:TonB-dependent receptor [Vicinamibacterales bacterium]
MKVRLVGFLVVAIAVFSPSVGRAQELGGAGTIQGTVKDQTGGAMQAVTVTLSQAVSGLMRTTTTDAEGKFVFRNVPPNPYHLTVQAQGFKNAERDVDVRTAVPISLDLMLEVGVTEAISVVGHTEELVERDPTAHTDVDTTTIQKLPIEASSGLNMVIMKASPGVAADANGFFHPLGDHAQTQFSIDNQPIPDQQSRIYSNQISPNAVQSMELMTGVAPAEFGDKTSLIARIVTKSGLDQKPTGSADFGFGWMANGSCANAGQTTTNGCPSPNGDISFGVGSHSVGNFLSLTGLDTDRLLDPPELVSIHGHGVSGSLFDRLDAHVNDADTFHLNVSVSGSSFDVPNTYDQDAAGQAQHQDIHSFNIAPGYTHVFSSNTLFAANTYVRRDHVIYSPSADVFADTPATVSQDRSLTNYGGKVDISHVKGVHNLKFGGVVSGTALNENTSFGLTDPTLNSPCTDADGNPSSNTGLTTTSQCANASLIPNDAFVPGLLPYDLSRGGGLFHFVGSDTIKQQAAYIQDEITAGPATFKLGVRLEHYDGLSTATMGEPRLGAAFAVPGTGTVLRASYGRTMETPYNENLLLSSSTGTNGFANPAYGAQAVLPLQPGKRDEVEIGAQQALGRWIVADIGYFNKHTQNGYDFDVLFNTPVVFPISWDHSRLNGITARVNLLEHGGLSAYTVMGHANAIYSNPENGGILFNSPIPSGDFRIDHDQKFQQTTNVQYVFVRSIGAWAALNWQYESGLVAGAVPDFATAMSLTPDQQAAIGLFCGNVVATLASPITSCSASNYGATRLVIPGTPANPAPEDDLTNPPRVASRNLFDLGFGVDNLFHVEKTKVRLRFTIINVTNNEALYNFLSTFSGTHFVTPRAYSVQIGVAF